MANFKNTRWQMIAQTGVIDLDPPYPTTHGDPTNYKYAKLPFPNDSRWTDAPTDEDGKLNFKKRSNITGYGHSSRSYKKVEFSYFRTYVNIPTGTDIQQFKVTISRVDDGARMYLFNNSHVGGTYKEADDAKLAGTNVSADFTDKAAPGQNMVLIVQFDDCPVENNLTGGVEILINNQVVITDPELKIPEIAFAPAKFKMETYGVMGRGREETTYWIGWNDGMKKPGIITDKEADSSKSYMFDIEREEVTNGIALKVTNYHDAKSGENYYLPNLQTSPHVYAVRPPLEHERDLTKDNEYNFISLESVSQPDAYLRHGSYVLKNEKGNKTTAVYRQDCTWHFHEIKS